MTCITNCRKFNRENKNLTHGPRIVYFQKRNCTKLARPTKKIKLRKQLQVLIDIAQLEIGAKIGAITPRESKQAHLALASLALFTSLFSPRVRRIDGIYVQRRRRRGSESRG